MKINEAIKELQLMLKCPEVFPARIVEAAKVAVELMREKLDQGVVELTLMKVGTISAEVSLVRYSGDQMPEGVVRRELDEYLVDQPLHSPAMQTKVTATTTSSHQLEQVTIRASVDVLVPEKEAET